MSFIQPCLKWVVNTWQRRLLAGLLFLDAKCCILLISTLNQKGERPNSSSMRFILRLPRHRWATWAHPNSSCLPPSHSKQNRPNFLPAQVLYQWVIHNDWFTQQGSQEDMFWLVQLSAQGLQKVWRPEVLSQVGEGNKATTTQWDQLFWTCNQRHTTQLLFIKPHYTTLPP